MKNIIISIFISVLISGLFSLYLFVGWSNSANQAVNYYQNVTEVSSVEGRISEIKNGEYIIIMDNGTSVVARVDSATSYATSFSPTQTEEASLYGPVATTSAGMPLKRTLKLKMGDRIEATSDTIIVGSEGFVAKTIKLIR
mgnify:CR=1 FL=1